MSLESIIQYFDKKIISNENFHLEKEPYKNNDLIRDNPINNLDFDSLKINIYY